LLINIFQLMKEWKELNMVGRKHNKPENLSRNLKRKR
jgi:hypothetical protein